MAARIAGFGGRPAIVAARPMANIASQVKRNERTERERDENRRLQGAVRTHFRRLERAVQAGDAEETAREQYRVILQRANEAARSAAGAAPAPVEGPEEDGAGGPGAGREPAAPSALEAQQLDYVRTYARVAHSQPGGRPGCAERRAREAGRAGAGR